MASAGPKRYSGVPGKAQSATAPTDELFSHCIDDYEIGNPIGMDSAFRDANSIEALFCSFTLTFLDIMTHFRRIGYGSSAVVFDATYKPSNKKVAIKIIDLDWFERNQIDELRVGNLVMR
jgi:hypothetical protein